MTDRNERSRAKDEVILRDFFRQVHAEERVPAFDRLARPGVASPARRWRPAAVATAVVLLAVAASLWISGPGETVSGRLSEAEQLTLAAELSRFEGPLDFLLDTPGRELLYEPPRLGSMAFDLPPIPDPEEN